MGDARLWKIAASGALAIGAVQAFSLPTANLLSVRMTRSAMLDGLWTRSPSVIHYPSWSTGQVEPDTGLPDVAQRCGGTSDLQGIAERTAEPIIAIREMAQSIYRDDIIESIAEAAPWWRVKLWQISHGLGLWSGRLDEPTRYLSSGQIAQARRFSDSWYRRVTGRIICDAVRAGGKGSRAVPPQV